MISISPNTPFPEDPETQTVESWLKGSEIHRNWISAHRSGDNDPYLEAAFDYIIQILEPPENSLILDVGCGSCDKSIRLAKRGLSVLGIDLSEQVLEIGRKNIESEGLASKITLQCENLRNLSFEDQKFGYVICWGVLMHIPDIESAVSELSRVLKPGGFLVISENNSTAIEIPLIRVMQVILRKPTVSKKTPVGIENWTPGSDKTLFCRNMNIRWLITRFEKENIIIVKRVAGQFTGSYGFTSSVFVKRVVHSFNNFWFKFIRVPQPAMSNILILQKGMVE